MKTNQRNNLIGLAAIALLASFSPILSAGDQLGKVLGETGWDRLVGTWVDQETQGESTTTTFGWKYDGTVMVSETKMPQASTTTMMGHNAATDEIYVFSVSSTGGFSKGSCAFEKDKATFTITITDAEGEISEKVLNYELLDDDTLQLKIDDRTLVFVRK